ncbi:hypothetical protein MCUN1_002149 [Malassezia cuniculi]|uniref:PITH domain-containing protein n=1 Tax=Malassezia cuniculi TaxID=948313 RepID=A0AAF0ER63_9BASI|nr:hypothetical protein MCUN1_002149 [Malassezia cuniculi]
MSGEIHALGPEGTNLYSYIHRERVWCTNVDPPESAATVIKPWDQRMTPTYVQSATEDAMIINIPFAVPVRIKSIVLNTGRGEYAPQRCTVYVNRPYGVDMDDLPGCEAHTDSRVGAPPESGSAQADFALLPGFAVYPLNAARFAHTTSVSVVMSEPDADVSRTLFIGFLGSAPGQPQAAVQHMDVPAANAATDIYGDSQC